METYERYKQAIDNYEFHGTECYHGTKDYPVVMTDGALWLFTNFECGWLYYLICNFMMKYPKYRFIVVKLHVVGGMAIISYEDGNYKQLGYQTLDSGCEMPDGEYEVWCANSPGNQVIYLSTEH